MYGIARSAPGPYDLAVPARTFTFVRHGQTAWNAASRLNGDPTTFVPLTELGRQQALARRRELAGARFDLAVHTRFVRTRQTLELLFGRHAPRLRVLPAFDDVRVGAFEGAPVDEYRAWRRINGPALPAPGGGEARLDALRRYALGVDILLASDAERVFACVHDQTIRFLANAVLGADPIAGPVRSIANCERRDFTRRELLAARAVIARRLGAG